MGAKALAIKFGQTDKKTIKGKVKHSRTGACTCRRDQRCYHGQTQRVR